MADTHKFLVWAQSRNFHPTSVPIPDLLQFLGVEGNGNVKRYMSAINSLADLAHKAKPYNDDSDLTRRRKIEKKTKSGKRKPIPIADVRQLRLCIHNWIEKHGSLQALPTKSLTDALATMLKIESGFRLTGLARIPWYEFARIPSGQPLNQCTTIFIAAVNTKEKTLRWEEGWSDPVPVKQDLHCTDPVYNNTRSGVLLAEWFRRVHLAGPLPPYFDHYGAQVRAQSMWRERSRTDSKGRDVWAKLDPSKLPTESTLSKRIQRVIEAAALKPTGLLPRHLRHYFASFYKLGRIDKGTGSWDELHRLMRHQEVTTTKQHYMLAHVHPSAQARWGGHTEGWAICIGRLTCL